MRKIAVLFFAVVFCFMLAVPVSAADKTDVPAVETLSSVGKKQATTFSRNEYDMYLELQAASVQTLEEVGYTAQEIEEIKTTSAEELLYERAQLSANELYNLGYSEEDVAILKAYDGSPLSQNPQLRGVLATFEGVMDVVYYSSHEMYVMFEWEWSNSPLLIDGSDMVACGFGGTNINNGPSTLIVNQSETYCSVSYYQGYSNTTYVGMDFVNVYYPNINGTAKADFEMAKSFTVGSEVLTGWAQKGTFMICVEEDVQVNELYSAKFAFGYGHTTVTMSSADITVSISGSGPSLDIGLTFESGTECMYYNTLRVDKYGNKEEFAGA